MLDFVVASRDAVDPLRTLFVCKSRKDYNCTLKKQDFHEAIIAYILLGLLLRLPIIINDNATDCWHHPLRNYSIGRRECELHRCELLYFRKTLLECLNIRGLCVQHQVSVAAWMGSGVSPEVGHCVPLVGFDWHFFWEGKVRVPFHPEKPSGTTSKLFQGLSA